MSFVNVIINQVLTKFEIIMALVVLIGYAALRRPASKVVGGAIKTAIGVMVLQAGSSLLVSTFKPIVELVSKTYGLKGALLDPYTGMVASMEALKEFSGLVGYTLILGFILNILIVRFSKLKAIFLTGHIMLLQAATATWMIHYIFKAEPWVTVTVTSTLLALYWSVFAHLLIKPTQVVTSSGPDFTVGHSQMFFDWLAAKIGHWFGNPETESMEKFKLPGWLSMMQDNTIATALVMTVFGVALLFSAGIDQVQKLAGAQHWSVFMLFVGMRFAVAITIILTGVRMFISELVPAFKGISEKLIPGSVPAVDCPVVFPFAPKSVTLGFICVTIGQVIAVVVLLVFKSPALIIPGLIPLFFDGGTVGAYANAHGGWKAVVVLTVGMGLLQVLGAALIVPVSGLTAGWIGNADWDTIWVALFQVFRLFSPA